MFTANILYIVFILVIAEMPMIMPYSFMVSDNLMSIFQDLDFWTSTLSVFHYKFSAISVYGLSAALLLKRQATLYNFYDTTNVNLSFVLFASVTSIGVVPVLTVLSYKFLYYTAGFDTTIAIGGPLPILIAMYTAIMMSYIRENRVSDKLYIPMELVAFSVILVGVEYTLINRNAGDTEWSEVFTFIGCLSAIAWVHILHYSIQYLDKLREKN